MSLHDIRRKHIVLTRPVIAPPAQETRSWPSTPSKGQKASRLPQFPRFNMTTLKKLLLSVVHFSIALLIFRLLRSGEYLKGLEFERIDSSQKSLDEWDRIGKFQVLESLSSSSKLKLGADVAGANIDHNGSTANQCLTERPLLLRTLLEKAPPPFSSFGIHSFILRSSYRVNARHFVAIGMSALALHSSKTMIRCEWHAYDQRRIEGRQYIVWPGEHHNLMYESAIHHCELDEATTPGVGGSLYMLLDEEFFVVYTEENGKKNLEPKAPFKYNLAFCSFPIYREVLPQRFGEWIQFTYRSVGVDYFVLHDGGPVDESFMQILTPYVKAGLMEIIDIRSEFQYESKHNVLTLNDCLYRVRWLANWALFIDFDEYLYVEPPRTFKGLLKEHSDAPYLTFGSLWWSTTLCRNSEGKKLWPVERMTFHWPHIYCVLDRVYVKEKCLNYYGHRKYVVNPRKVWVLEVHRPVDPIAGGVDVNTTIMRNNHYQGLLRSSIPVCSEEVKPAGKPDWWVEGNTMAEVARKAREAGPPWHKVRL